MKTAFYSQMGAQAPELIRLLPLGEVVLGDGRESFLVTRASLDKIMAAWNKRGNDMVIDYEHQTVTGQEAPAAGWVKALTPGADGLWARVVWTDRAKEFIEKREYRYFSPVVDLGEGREVVDLLHAALTNFPAMTRMVPLVLQHQGCGEGDPVAGPGRPGENETESEEVRKLRGGNMIVGKLRLIFGLQDDAPEDQILTRATDLVKLKEQDGALPGEIITSLGLAPGNTAVEALEQIELLRAEVEAGAGLREELAALKQEQARQRGAHLIQEALNSKKTTPAELDLAEGRLRRLAQDEPDFFRELIGARQENWAVPGPLAGGGRARSVLSQEEGMMCRALGVTPEAFLKNRARVEKGE